MLFSRRFDFFKAAEAYVTNDGSNNAERRKEYSYESKPPANGLRPVIQNFSLAFVEAALEFIEAALDFDLVCGRRCDLEAYRIRVDTRQALLGYS